MAEKLRTFPGDAVLVALLRGPKQLGMSVKELAEATGFSTSAVRANLGMMTRGYSLPWVEKLERQRGGANWRLTPKGHEIAKFRRRNA